MKANINKIGFIYFIFLVVAITTIGRIIHIQFVDPMDSEYKYRRKNEMTDTIMPIRGSILANDGRYLAFSTPRYRVGIDPTIVNDSIWKADLPKLCKSLYSTYRDRKPNELANYLNSRRVAGKQYAPLLRIEVDYDQLQQLKELPILKLGRRRGGFVYEMVDHREYPYGSLAYRVLGHTKRNPEDKPIGVEAVLDSVLTGKKGETYIRRIEKGNWIPDTEREDIPVVNGEDIKISIDIDIQDIAEKALLRKISAEPALEAGCAIVMDVKTGEIRAMVNMERNEKGKFTERYNYAIGQLGEPGSVFKMATLITALEDNKCTLETIQSADVKWSISPRRQFTDDYLKKYTTITVKKGFEISSNNVFRRLAYENYKDNPQEFVDKLINDRKIAYNCDFDLNGFGKAYISNPSSKHWNMADLAQIGMGYAVQTTPLHIATFYNAIANDGVMMKPHIFVERSRNGAVTYSYPKEELGRICSVETAKLAKEAARGVVIGENGTARNAFKDCKVNVAGKTGTARIVFNNGRYEDAAGRKKHQGSFVGFFPYEDPKYTIMVVVYSYPTHRNFYGGSWGGPVAREIIDNIYASSPHWNEPIVSKGVMPKHKERNIVPIQECDTAIVVPNVVGLGLKEAVNILEKSGFYVRSSGVGQVQSQSLQAGDINPSSRLITLKLE